MSANRVVALALLMFSPVFAAAKEKKKVVLPADVLRAETVFVMIDPEAGVAADAPMANTTARDDVEKALMKWGRFRLANDISTADLVITVRKGNGKIAQPTIGGVPTNDRSVIFQPADSGGRAGASHGSPPQSDNPTQSQYPAAGPHPQVEVGSTQDIFAVYRGKGEDALDSPTVWRCQAKDALRSPSVPAVDEFRKAIAEAEKQQAAKP